MLGKVRLRQHGDRQTAARQLLQGMCVLMSPPALAHPTPPRAAGTCLVVAAVTRGTAQRTLVVAARYGLAAASAALYLHTSELFPWAVREQGLAAANVCARAGGYGWGWGRALPAAGSRGNPVIQ